jgi:uncharacterized membrane-anchored protein YjiN (DUF445 family)
MTTTASELTPESPGSRAVADPRLAPVAPVPALPPAATPAWERPDDASRQAQLDKMSRRASALLVAAGGVFAAAGAYEGRYPWLGFVRATAEASLVGGLADWFAVTALFRHPLGIPIPHTAIVATRKDRIGRILGNFVENHFLSRDVIAARLKTMHLAERAARWLSEPANSRRIAAEAAGGLARSIESMPDDDMRRLVHGIVTDRLRALRVAPTLGRTLSLVLVGNSHQELLNQATRLAAQAVADNRELIRERVRAESPWWVPGVVDDRIYQRIVGAIERLLRDISEDPRHPLRATFDGALRDFVDRLQHSPEVNARAEALKEEWLSEAGGAELSARLWEATRRAVLDYATRNSDAARLESGATVEPAPGSLERGISAIGEAVASNVSLRDEIDDLITDLCVSLVELYRAEIGDFIAHTVASWDPAATSRRFELAVGRDLQFVRINGTLVGGLIGLAIYSVMRLWR